MSRKGGEKINRQLSALSATTLSKVTDLEAQCDELEKQLEHVEATLAAGSVTKEDLQQTKQQLAQSVGLVDKFQDEQVDAIVTADLNSGRAIVRQHRKELTQRVTALRERTLSTYHRVEQALQACA
ncbi:hypothetical protein JKP88DRAFT_231373 [Tribonema minus]|uniref:Uncharacterized protein n=1 Tax=Tribonema minus TaxID=303371 RepID=A0A836CPS7_9STRA|nr:hypothetical protein JKP88DRAFT_231373 [Tribonema minus]